MSEEEKNVYKNLFEYPTKIIAKSEKEKQQLSFLEDKIKETDKARKLHEMYSLPEERLSSKYYAFCEVLDFVNEGNKDE